eukprot:3804677-Rhodomonas_salina.2
MLQPERRESEDVPVWVAALAVAVLTPPPARPWCRKPSSLLARNARGLSADSHRAAYRPVRSSRGIAPGRLGMGNPRASEICCPSGPRSTLKRPAPASASRAAPPAPAAAGARHWPLSPLHPHGAVQRCLVVHPRPVVASCPHASPRCRCPPSLIEL